MSEERSEEQTQGQIMVVRPNVQAALDVVQAMQDIKARLLDENDVVEIQGKKYIKRSGWRKVALAFNISTEIVSVEREKIGDIYVVRVRARASALIGKGIIRISEEVGVCDSSEFTGNLKPTLHNIEAKATTRAINRAISNLVGGGELSAEEIIQGSEETVSQNGERSNGSATNGIRDIETPDSTVKNAFEMVIEKIPWRENENGTRWAYIRNKDGSISPEVEALLTMIKSNPEGTYTLNGKEYTADDKYLRERKVAEKRE